MGKGLPSHPAQCGRIGQVSLSSRSTFDVAWSERKTEIEVQRSRNSTEFIRLSEVDIIGRATTPRDDTGTNGFEAKDGLPIGNLNRAGRIAYMHIPKTAGTSFTALLMKSMNSDRSLVIVDKLFFPSYINVNNLSEDKWKHIYLSKDSVSENNRIVAGHISLSTFSSGLPDAQLLTILREPVCRILSNWIYIQPLTSEQLRSWGPEWEHRAQLLLGTLENFMAHPRNISLTDNLTLRMLLRPHHLIPEDHAIDERNDDVLVREALARLHVFDFIDIVENPRLGSNFARWIADSVTPVTLNRTDEVVANLKNSLQREFTVEVFKLLRSRTRLDSQLWEFVARNRLSESELKALRFRSIRRSINKYRQLAV
jgi:hypothetical protein